MVGHSEHCGQRETLVSLRNKFNVSRSVNSLCPMESSGSSSVSLCLIIIIEDNGKDLPYRELFTFEE